MLEGSIGTDLLGFYYFDPTVTHYAEGHHQHRENNPKTKLWIYLITEGLEKDDGHAKIIELLKSTIVVVKGALLVMRVVCIPP